MHALAYLRPATAVLAIILPVIFSTTIVFFPAPASAWSTTSLSSPPATEAATDSALIITDPHPARLGISPFYGHQTLRLGKRECLKNGTNFCFVNNSSEFCPDCGGCCELDGDGWCCKDEDATCCAGRVCCGAGETCCGDGCCSRGRSCAGGKCEAPVITVTSTRTVHATRTHTEVEVVTVQVKVHVTSTVNSIITTTVTSELGTHTEVTYVTTVLIVKRSLPSPAPGADLGASEPGIEEEAPDAAAGGLSHLWRRLFPGGPLQRPICGCHSLASSPSDARLCETGAGLGVWRRQDGGEGSDGTSTSTVTVTTTAVERTTVKDSRTTTDLVTLTVTTTIFQTSTRVIGARETVSVTSVVTITSRVPTTETVTSTSTWFLDPTPDDAPPPTATPPSSPLPPSSEPPPTSASTALPNRTIVGIGVGTGLAALALFLLAFVFLRRSRRKRAEGRRPAMDYVIAPAPAPIPPQRRDAYYGAKTSSPGHSRALSAATTQVSSGRASPDPHRGAAGAGAAEGGPERPQTRSIPHPSSSTVGRMTRFVEPEGPAHGGSG